MKKRKPLSTGKLRKRLRAGMTNKGCPDPFKRWKSDATTIRQNEIYKEIKKYGVRKDFWKLKQWWDFSIQSHRLVIKISSKNYKVNNSIIQNMERSGWKVLFINWFDPDGTSLAILKERIEFALDKPEWIEGRAKELNRNLPMSEKWFKEKIKQELFYKKIGFVFNKPMFGSFIYDLFSENYRLCIEVDGSIHDTPDQQQRDTFKTELTTKRGFNIIRVEAFNEESYAKCVLLIEQLIKNYKSKTYKVEAQSDFNNKIAEIAKSGKLPF